MNRTVRAVAAGLIAAGILATHAGWAGQQPPPVAPKFEFTIDTTGAPDMAAWAETLRPIVATWYPKIVEMLPSEGYTAPRTFRITIREMRGVAHASRNQIVCAAEWFRRNPDDRGAVVHELVHVVQSYRGRGNPGWLVEGVADYIRWFKYEPPAKRPRPNPDRAKYTDSYRTTGAFLEYVAAQHDHEIVVKLNAAMREGRYRPELWKEYTGFTVDELWEQYVATLRS